MSLTVTNSFTGETEVFEPLEEGEVSLYFCGLTVSDDAHLGHARSWVHTDVIRRWLEYSGYTVRHVENFTDLNEKIVARVGIDGADEAAVARHYTDRILSDMRSLNLRRPAVYPRVSEHIPEIITLVERLLDRDFAYEANGSVYFDVTTFPAYGGLSNQALEEMEVQEDEGPLAEKRHPQDFALWKAGRPAPEEIAPHQPEDAPVAPEAAVEGAATFDSPWGEGRPGWHIECSAMSTTHLGDTFDIHVAGHDIVFPHNENEIAQSEAASGDEFARYWLHTGLLRTDGEKMSSSLQNYFRVRDAVAAFGPNVLRMFFLSSIYRADQAYSEAVLAEAEERWERLARAYDGATDALASANAGTKVVDEELRTTIETTETDITAAMNDDFNTREALTALLSAASAVHRHLEGQPTFDYQGLLQAVTLFDDIGGEVFGFTYGGGTSGALLDDLVELVLDLREAEREAGHYERADELRAALADRGIEVQDTENGPQYRFAE